ncbi:hypothetical protein [Marinobacter sp. VGCF2001]|uniref:hypothetical protein n=1 Tax=Marinobacter sp. VGCF2001 TaxID=3417189 RepID=UPI003CEF832E
MPAKRLAVGQGMVRAIGVLGLVVGAIVLLALGPGWEESATPAGDRPECKLLSEPCRWETGKGTWRAELTTLKAGDQGMEYRLTVQAPAPPERFLAVLRGQSMYMGEYPVPLSQKAPTLYQATFTAPFCTTGGDMIWRIDLQDGQKVMENVPLTLVFRAEK